MTCKAKLYNSQNKKNEKSKQTKRTCQNKDQNHIIHKNCLAYYKVKHKSAKTKVI